VIERRHRLAGAPPGVSHELLSLHFGTTAGAGKAVIQASLHADEVPAMLVAHHLRGRLEGLEREDRLRGEVVLLPYANPLGLAQRLLHAPVGRFDLGSGENFNRRYADLVPRVLELLPEGPGADPAAAVARVRAALRTACEELPEPNELSSLRKTLLGLAIDADVVLDLHTDNEAVLHLYAASSLWPRVEPLARLLGAEVSLLADRSGDDPFDEACSTVWPRLAAGFTERLGRACTLPDSCVAVTVELRGEADVDHELAARDAAALLDYLVVLGIVDGPPVALPPLRREATPLAGSMPIAVPHAGVVVYRRCIGESLRAGDVIADLVDPAGGTVTLLRSPVDGVFYARDSRRFAPAGARIAKVAGREPLRSGSLLSE